MAMSPNGQCSSTHDPWTLALSLCLCSGLVVSYLPQHLRIISARSSEGFSPWYLLLGATSSASGMLNLLILQWPLFQCCHIISLGRCLESLLGFVQVGLQWFLFTVILVLYLVYFPHHVKYEHVLPLPGGHYGTVSEDASPSEPTPGAEGDDESSVVVASIDGVVAPVHARLETTPEWRLAVTLAWVVALHLCLLLVLSLGFLFTLPPDHPLVKYLATFLGLSGTLLAVCQYAPQIYKTYRARLVGALSLGTMAIQVPGSVLFVVSIAVREGTDWTSWLPYAVTGAMQGALLVICIMWKRRQAAHGVDDFGNKIIASEDTQDERAPLLSS